MSLRHFQQIWKSPKSCYFLLNFIKYIRKEGLKMENLDKYNELLLTKHLEEQDYELFIKRCKKFESVGFKEKLL